MFNFDNSRFVLSAKTEYNTTEIYSRVFKKNNFNYLSDCLFVLEFESFFFYNSEIGQLLFCFIVLANA